MYEMYEDNNYLAHYGVKGMKWGVRRAKDPVLGEKKAAYKQAKKDYNKSYSEAYKYSSRHPVGQWASKKKSAEADRRWEDAIDKAGKLNTAKSEYKQAKKDARNTPEAKAARKKALKVGAAVAGTALAAYGAYKVSKMVSNKNNVNSGKKVIENLMNTSKQKSYASMNADEARALRNTAAKVAVSNGYEPPKRDAFNRPIGSSNDIEMLRMLNRLI